jgi:hypothetical protein
MGEYWTAIENGILSVCVILCNNIMVTNILPV